MNVFISWSGARSRAIAGALHTFLESVIQEPNYFMSDKDIDAGQDWYAEVKSQLGGASFGLVCLTPENVNNRWVLFEAGAISKSSDATLIPILFDMQPSDLNPPLSQLQAKVLSKAGITDIINVIAKQLDSPPKEEARLKLIHALWESEVEEVLTNLPPVQHRSEPVRNSEDMIREILDIARKVSRDNSMAKSNISSGLSSVIERRKWPVMFMANTVRGLLLTAKNDVFAEKVVTEAYGVFHHLANCGSAIDGGLAFGEFIYTIFETTFMMEDEDDACKHINNRDIPMYLDFLKSKLPNVPE